MLLRALTVSLIFVAGSFADIPPRPPQGVRMQMRILKSSVGAGGPVLQIPSRLMTKHAAFLDIASPTGPGRSSTNLAVAGLLLSAAVILLGRWFWTRRGRTAQNANAKSPASHLVIAILMLVGSATLVRDASADTVDLNALVAEGQTIEGMVTVQVSNDVQDIVLHLTPPRRPLWRPQGK